MGLGYGELARLALPAMANEAAAPVAALVDIALIGNAGACVCVRVCVCG